MSWGSEQWRNSICFFNPTASSHDATMAQALPPVDEVSPMLEALPRHSYLLNSEQLLTEVHNSPPYTQSVTTRLSATLLDPIPAPFNSQHHNLIGGPTQQWSLHSLSYAHFEGLIK